MIEPWREVERNRIFEKYGRGVEQVTFSLPNGTTGKFYIRTERDMAVVLALTVRREVVLVRQFRPGPMQTILELPGGFVDPDETAIDGAKRELLEETGYAGRIVHVAQCLQDAYSTSRKHCYVATDCVPICQPQPDDTEDIEVTLLSVDNFRQLLRSGQMTDVEAGYLCLDYLNLL